MNKAAVFCAVAFGIVANANSGQKQTATEKAKAMGELKLCALLGKQMRSKKAPDDWSIAVLERAQKELGVRAIDYLPIEKRRIEIGMSYCSVYAALGPPEDANITSVKGFSRIQMVYPSGQFRYIYIEERNGELAKVTAWQN